MTSVVLVDLLWCITSWTRCWSTTQMVCAGVVIYNPDGLCWSCDLQPRWFMLELWSITQMVCAGVVIYNPDGLWWSCNLQPRWFVMELWSTTQIGCAGVAEHNCFCKTAQLMSLYHHSIMQQIWLICNWFANLV